MGSISLQQPQIGLPDTTEDVKVQNNFTTLQNVINGNLDITNLVANVARLQLVQTTATPFSAVNGQLIVWAGSPPGTINLPAPASNSLIAVYAGTTVSGASPLTVTASSGTILSVSSPSGSASMTLGVDAGFVMLQGNGANWLTVGGGWDTGWVNLTSFGTNISAGSPVVASRVIGDRVQFRGFAESSVSNPGNLVQIPGGIMPPASSDVRFYPLVYNGGAATVALHPGTPNWLTFNYASSASAGSSLDFSNIYWYLS